MEQRFTVLLIEVGVGILIEIALLIAVLVIVKKSAARMESLADEIQRRALPTLDSAQALLASSKPQVESILANLSASAATLKSQLDRVDGTITDAVDRTRLQVIRADELVTRTMDRVEETTDLVHHTVISPVRQLAGLVQGLTAGLNVFLGRRRDRSSHPHDEMFI